MAKGDFRSKWTANARPEEYERATLAIRDPGTGEIHRAVAIEDGSMPETIHAQVARRVGLTEFEPGWLVEEGE